MVICLFVGYMCSLCVRRRSPVKTFREPMGNSLVLLQAICDLFPVWDVSAEQTLRAWILSMPSSIRARLDALSLDELQQLSVASPPATATVYTQTVRFFMPRPLVLSSRLSTLQSHNTACSPPQRRLRRQHRYLAFLGTPRPLFLLRRGQVSPSRQPSSLFRRPAACFRSFSACSAALFRHPAACFRGFAALFRRPAASQSGLAAVRRSLVSQRSLVYAPLPTAELSPLSPAWAPQFLPGPALPTGPVAVLPPLPAEPAPPSPMSLEEEDLLLEVEEGQESTKL